MSIKHIYFLVTDGRVLAEEDISNIARVVDNKRLNSTDFEAVREYAKKLTGIEKELNLSSVEDLAKVSRSKAIILYRELNNTSLRESAEAVSKMIGE